jgi:hypothetical protein
MKYTQYFLYTRQRNDRKDIKLEWIQHVIDHAEREEVQDDGRIRRWAKIPEANDKYLRVRVRYEISVAMSCLRVIRSGYGR